MIARPIPTPVLHFTHVDHLPGMLTHGLLSDASAQKQGLVSAEVGNRDIKARRRSRTVPVPPGGVVADYVPFYFAPRSPMLYAIDRGIVPEYAGGIEPLVYLVSTIERLAGLGCRVVTTDRNAVLGFAAFHEWPSDLDDVDWLLMKARMWHNTVDEPDRRERRMAECLVHQVVPWDAVEAVHVRNDSRRVQVTALLTSAESTTPVHVTPDWYF